MKPIPWNDVLSTVWNIVVLICVVLLCIHLSSGWPLVILPFIIDP